MKQKSCKTISLIRLIIWGKKKGYSETKCCELYTGTTYNISFHLHVLTLGSYFFLFFFFFYKSMYCQHTTSSATVRLFLEHILATIGMTSRYDVVSSIKSSLFLKEIKCDQKQLAKCFFKIISYLIFSLGNLHPLVTWLGYKLPIRLKVKKEVCEWSCCLFSPSPGAFNTLFHFVLTGWNWVTW